jgi:hypothetical protein
VSTYSLLQNTDFSAITASPYPGSSLFIAGGTVDGFPTAATQMLSPSGWQYASPSFPVRERAFRHCMVQVNSTTVMVIGGFSSSQYSASTYLLNTMESQWIVGPSLQTGRQRKPRMVLTIRLMKENNHNKKEEKFFGGDQE